MQHPSRSPPTHAASPLTPPAGVASRFFVSMRKSFTPPTSSRRKSTESPRAAMYSTPEERHAYNTSRSRDLDSRPTIEQISMGLHVSRTPHLRPIPNPLQRHPFSTHLPCRSLDTPIHPPGVSLDNPHDRTRHSLPPPPPRSSMKKTSTSTSTLTQSPQRLLSPDISPSPPVNSGSASPRPLSSLRARMSKFITGYRPLSLASSLGRASSFTSSASDSTRPTTPRKAVRFSTSVLAINEQS